MFLGSDAIALAPFTNAITYLEDGDWAVVTPRRREIFDVDGTPVKRAAAAVDQARPMHGRQGQSPAFHGEGNP